MLTQRPGNLISDGIMGKCRNINYFGELMIYLSFALLAMHWLPLLFLGLMMAIVWLPNMIRKDRSLSRYSDFERYKKKSKLFIPYIF
jgi:steroid 5-alpha reductase family enzyme